MSSKSEKPKKIAVVTGASRGLGYEVVKELCNELKDDGLIYLTAQDKKKGKAAIKKLNEEGCYPEFYEINATDIDTTMGLRNRLINKYNGFDILINNAGIRYDETNPPISRYDMADNTLLLNFFYTFHITGMFWGALRPYARVVNVACSTNLSLIRNEEIRERFLNPRLSYRKLMILMNEYLAAVQNGTEIEQGWPESPYDMAKLGLVVLTAAQQREFNNRHHYHKKIIINAVNPGSLKTQHNNFTGKESPTVGAKRIVKIALLPEFVTGPKGKFIWHDMRIFNWQNGTFYSDPNLEDL